MPPTSARAVTSATLLTGLLVILVRTAWLGDDAYITLRTVDNALDGLGLRWNPSERVQAFTHPLWCLLLVGAGWVLPSLYAAAMSVSILCSLGAVGLVVHRAPTTAAQWIAGVTLGSSMAFVSYSTSGLENPMTHLLAAAFALSWLEGGPSSWQRTLRLTVLASLMATNRLDSVLLVAPAMAWHLVTERVSGWWRAVALGVTPILLWEAFSVVYYGAPVPNTAYAKLGTGVGADDLAVQGLHYLLDAFERDPITPLAILAGLTSAAFGAARERALAVGVTASLIFVVTVGGDFMSGRFLTAPLLLATLLLVRHIPGHGWRPALAVAASVALGLMAEEPNLTTTPRFGGRSLGRHGISNERKYYYPATGLALTARDGVAPRHEWADEGRRLRAERQRVATMDAVGFLGFEAGPEVHVIDVLGLGDPLLSRLPSRLPPWRIGHFYRRVPAGYLETVASGQPQFAEPPIAALHAMVAQLTTGEVWTWARFQAIAALALRRHQTLIDQSSYGTAHLPLSALSAVLPDGTPRDAPGVYPIREGGLVVALPAPARVRRLAVSLDADDRYRLELLRNNRAVAGLDVGPDQRTGLVERYLAFASAEEDITGVRITVRGGDRRCAIGHLRVSQ